MFNDYLFKKISICLHFQKQKDIKILEEYYVDFFVFREKIKERCCLKLFKLYFILLIFYLEDDDKSTDIEYEKQIDGSAKVYLLFNSHKNGYTVD